MDITRKRSDTVSAIAGALAKAQGGIQNAEKSSENPYFKSRYADLASVWDVVRQPLSTNGLAVLQFPRATAEGVEVETLLVHESGEWFSEILALPVSKHDAQGIGSAITYARRYMLQSFLGVAAEEDDDGNAASNGWASKEANALSPQEQLKARQANPRPPAKQYCTQQQRDALRDIADELGLSDEARLDILRKCEVKRASHLTADQCDDIILNLMRRRVADLLAELQFNLDDVRNEDASVSADTPDELDMLQANAALAVLRAAKERAAV